MIAVRVAGVVVVAAAALRLVARARWWPRAVGASSPREPAHPPHWFAALVADTGMPPGRAWTAWRLTGPVAVLGALASGSPWPMAFGAALLGAPWAARGPLRRRAEQRIEGALPLALDAVARSLDAGASLRQALADAATTTSGPVGVDLRRLVASTRAGLPLDDALRAWAARCPVPGVHLVVAALGLASETGGASARAVEGVAATLRRRQAAVEETLALSAQARASALVLACAPLAVCAVTVVSGGPAARFLLGTPIGGACFVGGLGLDALGWWWMTRLIRGAVGR